VMDGWFSKQRADQMSFGVLLMGLGLMLAKILPWWPGIVFIGGAAALIQAMAEGEQRKRRSSLVGGIVLIAIGVLSSVGSFLPLLLILLGGAALFRNLVGPSAMFSKGTTLDNSLEKPKREKTEGTISRSSDLSGQAATRCASLRKSVARWIANFARPA